VPELLNSANTKPVVLGIMAKNAVANLFRTGTGWVILLFLPPLLVRVLDKPTYSVWMLLLQVAAYVTVFDGGIQMSIARFVARAEPFEDPRYIARLLSSAGLILVSGSMATIALTVLASWQLNHLFHDIPALISGSAREALLLIGVSVALTLPFSVLAGFFAGLQKNEITAFAGSVGRFAGALGTAWAAFHHQGLVAMAAWTAFGTIAQSLILMVFWNRQMMSGLLRPSYVSRSTIREFLLFCSAMFVAQFSSILISGMDIPIVVAFDFHSAAYYAVAATLSNALIVPHGAIVSTVMPVAAGMSSGESPERLGGVLEKTTRFATAILCLIALPLLLVMPLFLRVWVGPEYAIHTLRFAEILVAAQFVRLTMAPYAFIGYAAGQFHRMLIAAISEGVVNLLFSLVAVRIIGAQGVAIGTLVGAVVSVWLHFSVSLPRTDCVVVDRKRLLWTGILKPSFCALPILLAALLLTRWILRPLPRLGLFATSELVLFVLFWKFSFDAGERGQIKALLHSAVGRSGKMLRFFLPESP
jgi:O-antigen/teichoic acid export membrane protein